MRPARVVLPLALALLFAGLGAADVLVTTDGTVVETKGPWQQRGKMVIFTLANGQLSSLRASDVDFEATEQWREELTRPPAPKETSTEAAPKARLVLTDADVARGDAYVEPATVPADGAAATQDAATDPNLDPASQSPVRVLAWEDEEPADGRGRLLSGTLRNDGNTFATDISVEVTVYDNEGAIAGTQTATPVRTNLRPGESTTFSVQFLDTYIIGATRFRVGSLDLVLDDGEDAVESPEI